MNTIVLHTKDDYFYGAEKHTDSELMMQHLNFGEHKFYSQERLEEIKKLANAHGWTVIVQNDKNI